MGKRMTGAMRRLNVGDTVCVRGPYGDGWPLPQMAGKDVLIVAGGIGLAPMRPVICYLTNHPEEFGQVKSCTAHKLRHQQVRQVPDRLQVRLPRRSGLCLCRASPLTGTSSGLNRGVAG